LRVGWFGSTFTASSSSASMHGVPLQHHSED
jgi:hypothetical protein